MKANKVKSKRGYHHILEKDFVTIEMPNKAIVTLDYNDGTISISVARQREYTTASMWVDTKPYFD